VLTGLSDRVNQTQNSVIRGFWVDQRNAFVVQLSGIGAFVSPLSNFCSFSQIFTLKTLGFLLHSLLCGDINFFASRAVFEV
jgi:hypothetical protein